MMSTMMSFPYLAPQHLQPCSICSTELTKRVKWLILSQSDSFKPYFIWFIYCHIHDLPPTPPYASASPLRITSTQVHFHFHLSTFPPRYSASTCLLNSLPFSLPFNAILLAPFPFGDKSYSLPLICCCVIPVISRYHYLVLTFWHTYSAFPPLAILLFPAASFPFSIPPPPTVYKHSPSHYVL